MRQGNKLSAAAVRNASKPGLYGDGHGLYLQVSKFGTKAWLFRYMMGGVARKMGLGAVHTIGLADARKRASEARIMVHDGLDPIDARKHARARVRLAAAKAITFKECADRYIATHRDGWKNSKHADQWISTFAETNRGSRRFPAATAAINDLPVSAIDTGLVLKVLEPIWAKTPETASRIRGRIESVLDWAKVREYRAGDNPARWDGHLKEALPGRKASDVQHHPALPYQELPAMLAELRAKAGVSARALEFTILTAARTGEAIGARWSEISESEIDVVDERTKRPTKTKMWVWRVPAERMKGGKEHRVPLSKRALEILKALPRDGEFVFPGGKSGRPLSNMAMLELVRGMRGKGATVHGFRSTFRDWCAETTSYPNEMCEIALAHAVSDKTEAAYRRGDMMEKRRKLMAEWAAYCETPITRSGNVTSIRAGTAR